MMNMDVKVDFIALGNESCIKYFGVMKEYEREFDKDLSLFTADEIITVYSLLASSSYLYLTNINAACSKYTQYCLAHNLIPDGQNHYAEITREVLLNCLNKAKIDSMILSEEDIDGLDKYEDLAYSDRCLVRAVFEGISGKMHLELANLNVNQLDDDILHLETRDLKISQKLMNLMQASTDDYYYTRNTEYGAVEVSYSMEDTNVFKMAAQSQFTTDSTKSYRIYHRMQKIQTYMNGSSAYTFGALRTSGKIDMIKRFMAEDKTTAEEAIKAHKKEIEERFQSKITSIAKFVGTYQKYFE